MPVGTYAHVRLTLRGAQARIAAGGSVGGITLSSELSLTLGGSDAQVVVQKQVQPFQISAGTRTAIVFELNSETWATAQNAQDRMVEDAEVQTSAAVAIRSGWWSGRRTTTVPRGRPMDGRCCSTASLTASGARS